ncbi:hypothetical protein BwSH20_03070 [Bradyrhizobium ottawaense]|jgi:hypothetical protein|nr:hypothetical protein SG09_23670 [Bradyrhizobium ottawaense]GMO28850.1 hypothetical protein BwSF12_26060 [Bradyrhizobium ottawaense]GMO72449.1 hypothetical protein BwSG20_39280 [Bradyrhizobium ottawaense]GMO74464.1 hypothetical protein BwSG10_37900 [Bradyrhizobium ottawaense]GMO92397.1 hypothetical protein BwSH20_03070 [Bradyrhizobium ottawaense]
MERIECTVTIIAPDIDIDRRRNDAGRRRRESRHRPARRARGRCLPGRLGIINHDLFLSNGEVQKVIRRSIDGTTA